MNRAIRFRPTDGLQVRARGRISVYEPRGEYQLVVESLDPVGAGALRIAFEQMRDRLAAEGLFDKALKRPLPRFPHRIGVVTSPSGAAIRDILNVVSRRTRTVHVLFSPARVQGEGAALEIVRAIELLNDYHQQAIQDGRQHEAVDVIIIGRGGGSAEDLWEFNDERLARAIRASQVPIISAVGHETDFTISDFAADVRAPTPSAAAELVAAREDELTTQVQSLTRDLMRATRFQVMDMRTQLQGVARSHAFEDVRERVRGARTTVDLAGRRLETRITSKMQALRRVADSLSARLSPLRLGALVSAGRNRFEVLCAARDAAGMARLEGSMSRLRLAVGALDALSPLAVLERGYALAQDRHGRLIRDAGTVQVGERVGLRLAKGALQCRVEEIDNT